VLTIRNAKFGKLWLMIVMVGSSVSCMFPRHFTARARGERSVTGYETGIILALNLLDSHRCLAALKVAEPIKPKGKRTTMSLRATILKEIETVAANQNKTLQPLTDALPLNDSGLDSLCFAILVARLEDITGRDPLSEAQDGQFPRTIGEFIALYEGARV
jgi:acyl carrier protein